MNAEAGRIELVRDQVARLPDRVGGAVRNWIADRRLNPDDRAAVQLGFAAEPETAEAMRRAAAGVLDPVTQRLRRWLTEHTAASPTGTRAAALHDDFVALCSSQGLPPLRLAPFARRLHALGVERIFHTRTRQSVFRLALGCGRDGAQP